MTVYHYDGVSREFLGTGAADVSPLEPGVYLIPANATTNQPPEPQEGYACVWTGEVWRFVEDHRGAEGYVDGVFIKMTELGPLPDEWSENPSAPTKEELAAGVRFERDRRMREVYDPAVNQLRRKIDTAQEAGETEEASALRERLFVWHAYANALETLPEQPGFPWNGPQDPEAPWPEEPV